MHQELWKQLEVLDRSDTCKRSGCRYESDSDRYILNVLNKDFFVDVAEQNIYSGETDGDFLEQLCILAYLISSRDIPLRNRLVKAVSLRGGAFFFRGPHELPTEKLEQAFGEKPELLYRSIEALKAKKCGFGDASIEVFVLPRVPVTFVIWGRDEEFSARASILFDKTAADQLALDALLAVVNMAISAVISNSCEEK